MYPDTKEKSSTLPLEERIPFAIFIGIASFLFMLTGILFYSKNPGSFILVVIGLPFFIISIMTIIRDWKEWRKL
jgi:hypothetical protein